MNVVNALYIFRVEAGPKAVRGDIQKFMLIYIRIDLQSNLVYTKQMTKVQLLDIIKKVLETDSDLDFLSRLSKSELETLVAAVRNRVENFGES
ncbi:hypothetical protein LCGC14_2131090 [marine sediment metagenome]|uniref:Uncharacterized protein n=1 Tax=marine sediment metagenome TaxID=412755 RepID=A0A0F9E1D2_9ZZZZ